MHYVWAVVLGLGLAGGSASADVFQKVREQGPRFKARVAKSVPHFRDADGRFIGYVHRLNGAAEVITEDRRVLLISVDGFLSRVLYFESADCSGVPFLKSVDGGGGGFMTPSQVYDNVLYEAAGPRAEIQNSSILSGGSCFVRSSPRIDTLYPSRVVEVLDFTPPFELH